MKLLTNTIARILFAVPFAIFGAFHFMAGPKMGGMVPSWIPGGVFWVYLTGVAMIVAAVAILLKREARLACYGLAAMLGVFVLTVHLPGLANPDENMMMMAMVALLKDTALAGAALGFAGILGGKK